MSLRVPKLIRPIDLLHNPPPKRKKNNYIYAHIIIYNLLLPPKLMTN